ncbi:MAG: hypothetical protein HLUCCA11_04725 [Phormidesmis priestleyi Ana]|uniref:DUF2141 domain-containing protein n=1 Tax=Phormidesmis priestleyi Ana TaxID=1666911 RepID=A0A0P7Z166_9CYAN|nr:MAG: hypothetical protein HLUCCA11_04725 [Phormidesmis priestleyi Ana]
MLPTGLLLALLSLSAAGSAQAQLPSTGRLRAEVGELKNTNGQVCFSLFKNGNGFPNNAEAILETQCVAANTLTTASISVSFEGLALGTYAVSVIHDENEDGELNTGNFGIPTEGFGFSQNPAIQMRAPDFSEAAVGVVGPDSVTQVELVYY